MKKGTIIALIVAAVLIVSGAAITAAGLFVSGSNGENWNAATQVENRHVFSEEINGILIKTEDCDVTFVKVPEGDHSQVLCRERERVYHSVKVEDGVLKVELVDNRKWYDHIGIFSEEMEMTVRLPEAQYESLRVETATGDITVPQALSFAQAQCVSATGEVEFSAPVTESLIANTDTGDIEIRGSATAMLTLESDTGDISVKEIKSDGELHIMTDTGSIELENIQCRILNLRNATGDIELERVFAADHLQAYNDTGDVTIKDSDAGTVNIETATGDVTGNFLSSKNYSNVFSESGRVGVPDANGGGECRIKTDTGNILIK